MERQIHVQVVQINTIYQIHNAFHVNFLVKIALIYQHFVLLVQIFSLIILVKINALLDIIQIVLMASYNVLNVT